jgi:para-aminobenzoate synthetase component I
MMRREYARGHDLGRLQQVCGESFETFLLDDALKGRVILGVDPIGHYRWHRGRGELRVGAELRSLGEHDPFAVLRDLLHELPATSDPGEADLPFCGGLLGYLGYDAGRAIEELPDENPADSTLPDLYFGLYDFALILDESSGGVVAVCAADPTRAEARFELADQLLAAAAAARPLDPWRPRPGRPAVSAVSRRDYLGAVEQIRELIRAGEVYQVNYTQRFLVACEAEPLALFLALRQKHPAAYGAFGRVGEAVVLSSSPECFLRLDGDRVETRPIKGTAPRTAQAAEDQQRARALSESEKDRAELAMIVDLMRNDLSRVCRPGSVEVPEHAVLQTVPTVHHLVSRVLGRLEEGSDVFDLLRATHPGGSITGAPKIAAMRAIDALEPLRRGIYTGGIGHIGRDGRAELNIAIRTLVLEAGWAHVYGGGGIVIDSDPASEYDESLAKISGLLDVLGAEVTP